MINKKCDECGKDFEVDNSKRNWRCVILCSDACRLNRASRVKRERYVRQEWPQEMVCEVCHKTFFVNNSSEKSRRRYCTRDCYLSQRSAEKDKEWQQNRQPIICKSCGKAFLPAKFNSKRQKFCSKFCFSKEHRVDPINNTAEFNRIRKQVRKSYEDTCQICGSKSKPQVHHWDNSRDGDFMNNDTDNLTVLCRNCHTGIHHISVIKVDNQWKVSGKIFEKLGINGNIDIY